MNNILFNFFFSLSTNTPTAWFFVLISNTFIYLFILLAILYPIYKNRDYLYGILIASSGAIAYIVSYIAKHIFMAPRPFITLDITPLVLESSYSFPSSHVTVIAALSILIWKLNHKLGYIFFTFTILIMASRMILGVHYPVDVLGGLILGILIGFFTVWFYEKTNQLAFLRKIIK